MENVIHIIMVNMLNNGEYVMVEQSSTFIMDNKKLMVSICLNRATH